MRVRVDVLRDDAERRAALHEATLHGLNAVPKQISAIWLYDERGSLLFDEITRLSEYYLTRVERLILVEGAPEIASETRAESLVELGSGTSEKTRLLLDALVAQGTLRRFVPLDVSEDVLVASAHAIAYEYPGLFSARGRRRLRATPRRAAGGWTTTLRLPRLDDRRSASRSSGELLARSRNIPESGRHDAARPRPRQGPGAHRGRVRGQLRTERELPTERARQPGSGARLGLLPGSVRALRRLGCGARVGGHRLPLARRASRAGPRTRDPGRVRRRRGSAHEHQREVPARPFEAELAAAGLQLARWWTDGNSDFAVCVAVPSGR